METQNQTTQAEGVANDDFLATLDALYEERGKIQHQAIWGGSYETEARAHEDLRTNANAIFETTLKLLKSREENK